MSRPIGAEEPPADARQLAKGVRGIYAALVQEGFSEHQALAMIGTMLAASVAGGQK